MFIYEYSYLIVNAEDRLNIRVMNKRDDKLRAEVLVELQNGNDRS